jgi:hypothetical protein
MKILITHLIILFILVACKGAVTYIIPQGEHTSGTHAALFSKRNMKFSATFDNSAIYTSADPTNQLDINKLYGFSDCNSEHQTNSARFGWRWNQNQLQIHAYVYTDSVRSEKFITAISLNQTYQYEILTSGNEYQFSINGLSVKMPRGCDNDSDIRYKLFPYFGGDEVAPHKISITILE